MLNPASPAAFRALCRLLQKAQRHADILTVADRFASISHNIRLANEYKRIAYYESKRYEEAFLLATEMAEQASTIEDDQRWITRIQQRLASAQKQIPLTHKTRAENKSEYVLFDGKDIQIVVCDRQSDIAFLTFSNYPTEHKKNDGFAKGFVQKNGFSGVFVISKTAHWWQTAEMEHAKELIAQLEFFKAAKTRFCYATSMGGFAALLYAADLGCERALVVAPQISVDPAIVPFEHRWDADVATIQFQHSDARSGIKNSCFYYIAYDPFDILDKHHIQLIDNKTNIAKIPVSFGGHTLLNVFLQLGILKKLVIECAQGSLNIAETRTFIRKNKHKCAHYFDQMSKYSSQKGKHSLARYTANQAFSLDRTSVHTYKTLAKIHRDMRDFAELERISLLHLEADQQSIVAMQNIRIALYETKQYEKALRIASTILQLADAAADDVRWVARIQMRLRQFAEAAETCEQYLLTYEHDIHLLRVYLDALSHTNDDASIMPTCKQLIAHPQATQEDKNNARKWMNA